MVDFYRDVIQPAQQAEAFVAQTGGLPEITRAAQDLITALGQTRAEIESAVFAERFPNVPSDYFSSLVSVVAMNPISRSRIYEEGEAGHKRSHLEIGLTAIEAGLMHLLHELVELRTDLIVSQQEFTIE